MQLAGSKDGDWMYTDRHPEPKWKSRFTTAVRNPWRTGPDVIRRGSTREAEAPTMRGCTMFVSFIGLTLLFSVQGFSQSGTWTTKAPMPTARLNLATGAVGGKLYAIGGSIGGNQVDVGTNEAYDPITDTWTAKASMPTPDRKSVV